MIKTGILGGTFNPIHKAHLAMAKAALKQAQLDEVWIMPSQNPPHKIHSDIVSNTHRKNMIEAAIHAENGLVFSDFEWHRTGTTYTADTLRLLQEQYPGRDFYFIMGGDSLFQFDTWYHPEEITKRATLLALARPENHPEQMEQMIRRLQIKYNAHIQLIPMNLYQISSSQIRQRIAQGLPVCDLLDDSVWRYINENQLYQEERTQ